MWASYLTRQLVQFNSLRNVNRRITTCCRLHQSKHTAASEQPSTTDADVTDALDIESSLFDNSRVRHEPTPVGVVMRQSKIQKQTLPKAQPPPVPRAVNSSQTPKSKQKIRKPAAIIKDPELGLEFARLRLGDAELATLMTTVRSRKRRDKQREIIIEGRRLIEEALRNKLELQTLIFSQRAELEKLKPLVQQAQNANSAKIFMVTQHDLKTWSTLTTPPGLMAIFKRPSVLQMLPNQAAALPITVVCDNIREPNNLGSIIRTCAALPCEQLVVTRGCCDPWESKALRGGCGGHFRLPIRDDVDWADVPLCIPPELANDCYIFVAENNLQKVQQSAEQNALISYENLRKTGAHNVLVIGGESHGVSQEAYKFMSNVGPERGKCLYIPLADGIDSLNVASALTLLLFELRKQLQRQESSMQPDDLQK